MKFQSILVGFLLSKAKVDSSLVVSKSDPHQSSGKISNEYSESNEMDTNRLLHPVLAAKKDKKTKKDKKNGPAPSPTPPAPSPTPPSNTVGALFGRPHKLEYEHRTLCIPGVQMHGCSDEARQRSKGGFLHEHSRARRYVKHTGAFAAKSYCDYADEITSGAPPDIRHPIGSKVKSKAGTTRDEKCKASGSRSGAVEMEDPAKHFKFEAVIVENNKRLKKYTARVYDMMDKDGDTSALHMIHAGLQPDTVVYLEGMDGKPYKVQSTNGQEVLHETIFTKFELLDENDNGKSAEEIARAFGGFQGPIVEDEIILPLPEVSEANKKFDLKIPPKCDSDSEICLQLKDSVSGQLAEKFDLDFNMNGKSGGSIELTTNLQTAGLPDPRLLKASASAEGCLMDGIKSGLVDFNIQGCMKGSFDYDSTRGDQSPAKQTYEVFLSVTASAGILGHDVSIEIDGSLKVYAESVNGNEYFIGYDGYGDAKADFKVGSASMGIGVDYDTKDYKTYNQPDGWGTKFYGNFGFELDVLLFHHSSSFTHVFSCEPSDAPICSSGNPVPSIRYPGAVLNNNDTLQYNAYMLSNSGSYKLWMQSDGNLVVYGPSGPKWTSNTAGKDADHVIFQDDGNFVMYARNGGALFSTSTGDRNGHQLVMQDDGNLVVYDTNGNALWACCS